MRIPIYSRDMTRIGTIRHASKVGYKRMFNDLHTASFEIPAIRYNKLRKKKET